MSRERQICVLARQVVNPGNPAQVAWLERCYRDVIAQGTHACTVASSISRPPPTVAPQNPPPPPTTMNDPVATIQRPLTVLPPKDRNQGPGTAAPQVGSPPQKAEPPKAEPSAVLPPMGRVRHAKPTANGPMSSRVVANTVRQHSDGLRSCYDRRLASLPTLSGKVVLQFTIDETGAVTEPAVKSSTLTDQALESCLTEAVRPIPFPAPKRPVAVTYPLLLTTP